MDVGAADPHRLRGDAEPRRLRGDKARAREGRGEGGAVMAPVALERSQFAREGMMETLVGLIRVGVASGARIAADAMYEGGWRATRTRTGPPREGSRSRAFASASRRC